MSPSNLKSCISSNGSNCKTHVTTPISLLFRFIVGRSFQVFDDLCRVSSYHDVRRYVFSDNRSSRNNASKYLTPNWFNKCYNKGPFSKHYLLSYLSPIFTPGHRIAPPPIQHISPIVISFAYSTPLQRSTASTGWVAV